MKITFTKFNLLIYLSTLVACTVFASFYGGPVAYAPLFALLFLIPVSALYIASNFISLRLYQEVDVHRLTKGEVHSYRASLENAGILPIHDMTIGIYTDRCLLYEISSDTRISLDTREKKELLSGINCLFAGAYNVGIESVSFADPFHIFEITIPVTYSFRAIVKPRITDIADKSLDLENIYNSTGQKSLNRFEDIPGNDLRPYRKGERMSTINWKIFAKQSELMVRLPDRMEKRSVSIIMNALSKPEREQDTAFLKARDFFLEFVVSSAKHFADLGIPVTVIYPAGRIIETRIDSYKAFIAFYNSVSDGLFYSSESEFAKLKDLISLHRSAGSDYDTWITINEAPGEGENIISICG